MTTYHQISDDHCQQEERNAYVTSAMNAVPHGLDPLSAQHSKHDHEWVEKVREVPVGSGAVKPLIDIVRTKELHAHDSKDEDDDGKDKAEVTEGTHGSANDANEQVQRWPWLG